MTSSRATPDYRWRARTALGLMLLLFLLLAGRVLSFQVLDMDHGAQFLQRQGAERTVRSVELPAYRGLITDRRGEPLAISTPVITLSADPRKLPIDARLEELARRLDLSPDQLEQRVRRYANRRYMYLRRHLAPERAREILALGVPGVRSEREYRRFYPAGEVSAQLVGMTDLDGRGVAGLELAYDQWLRGRPGRRRYLKDLRGDAVRDIGIVEAARPGRNLQLAIDLRLQYFLHAELSRAVALTGAEAGVIVTLDSGTGELLASVSHPHFNPNNRAAMGAALRGSRTRNRALTDVFEPGSIVKPLTLVAALESGRYSPDTLIDTSPGRIRVGPKVLLDPRDYGTISLARAVQKSSQVGITRVSLDIGHEPVWELFRRFGLGESTASGFPGERSGLLPRRPRWRPIEQVTLAFGYGLTVTPLQIARAYAAFANGGVLPDISLLHRQAPAGGGRRVIDTHTARQVREVLHGVTAAGGTATRARIAGYAVGGKTGTVHKVGDGAYLSDQYVALFAGIAPIGRPRVVTVVVLDRPKGDNYGGSTAAAPVFARIAGETLRLLGVPPELPAVSADARLLAATENAL